MGLGEIQREDFAEGDRRIFLKPIQREKEEEDDDEEEAAAAALIPPREKVKTP